MLGMHIVVGQILEYCVSSLYLAQTTLFSYKSCDHSLKLGMCTYSASKKGLPVHGQDSVRQYRLLPSKTCV